MLFYILIACLSSALEAFFQYCVSREMIFDFYGKWLHDIYHKGYKKIAYVLGYCGFCHGFWLFVFFYVFVGGEMSVLFLLYAGINFVFTKIFLNIYNYE